MRQIIQIVPQLTNAVPLLRDGIILTLSNFERWCSSAVPGRDPIFVPLNWPVVLQVHLPKPVQVIDHDIAETIGLYRRVAIRMDR